MSPIWCAAGSRAITCWRWIAPTGVSRTTSTARSTSSGRRTTAARVRRGHGLPVSALLRVLAYNLLELLRAVHLRSEEARAAAWVQLRDWVRDALVWPDLTAGDQEQSHALA